MPSERGAGCNTRSVSSVRPFRPSGRDGAHQEVCYFSPCLTFPRYNLPTRRCLSERLVHILVSASTPNVVRLQTISGFREGSQSVRLGPFTPKASPTRRLNMMGRTTGRGGQTQTCRRLKRKLCPVACSPAPPPCGARRMASLAPSTRAPLCAAARFKYN